VKGINVIKGLSKEAMPLDEIMALLKSDWFREF
jgi:hypothetical protein